VSVIQTGPFIIAAPVRG